MSPVLHNIQPYTANLLENWLAKKGIKSTVKDGRTTIEWEASTKEESIEQARTKQKNFRHQRQLEEQAKAKQ